MLPSSKFQVDGGAATLARDWSVSRFRVSFICALAQLCTIGTLTLCASHVALAQSPTTAPPSQLATASAAVSPLHLKISTDKPSYHVGEAIRVQLNFTSDVEHAFQIVAQASLPENDSLDELSITPAELAPPYNANEAQLVRPHANPSHEDIQSAPLGTKGSHYTLLLNDRFKLKKPGVLHLTIVSRRVVADFGANDKDKGGETAATPPPFPVTSNTLTITIVPPTPAWQAAELADIKKQLDTIPSNVSGAPSPERQQAIDRLIYLNSPAAAREMVQRFVNSPDVEQEEYATGMALSDHRSAAIEAANKFAGDPTFGITFEFQSLVSILPMMDKLNESNTADLDSLFESSRVAAEPQFLTNLNGKQGKAFETTLETLERMKSVAPDAAETAALQQSIPRLIAMFHDLSPDEQQNWLGNYWQDVKDPAWVPLLRSIATEPVSPGFSGTSSYQSAVTGRSEALESWAQLDPEGARQTVLNAMMSNDPQFGDGALLALPDKTLPDAQQRQLAQLFLAASDPDAQRRFAGMLERYGGQTAWNQISSAVSQSMRLYTCDTQIALLSFAFGVAPDAAGDLLETAMAPPDNGSTECRPRIFSSDIRTDANNTREKYAIAALNDPNPSVVGSAARFLGAYGSAKAEDPLWKRYESWALAAAAAAPVGKHTQITDSEEFQLGATLAESIEQGRGWLTDREKLERLNTLGGDLLGKPMVSDDVLAAWMRSPVTVDCYAVSDTDNQFNIAQYTIEGVDQLKARLATFPDGTTLAWNGHACASAANYSAMFNDIASASSLKGVTLKSVDALPAGTVPPPASDDGNGGDDTAPAPPPSHDSGNAPSPDAQYIVPDRVVVVN